MSPTKLAVAVISLMVAPMLTGCLVAERPAYYRPHVHYYRPVHRVYLRGSAAPVTGADGHQIG